MAFRKQAQNTVLPVRSALPATLLVVLVSAGLASLSPALGEPSPSGDSGAQGDPYIVNERGEAFHDGEVESVMAQSGLNDRAARMYMALSARVPALAKRAEAMYPETYAGGYIDADMATFVLQFTRDAERSAAAVAKTFFRPRAVRAATVAFSLQQLGNVRAAIRADRDKLAAEFSLTSWNVDIRHNELVVGVAEMGPDIQSEFERRYPDVPIRVFKESPGKFTSIPPAQTACEINWTSCNPLRGSTNIVLSGQGQGAVACTLGYNATRNSDGLRVILTAGHCSDGTRYHSAAAVGALVQGMQQTGGNADAQANHVASGWSHSRWIIHNGSSFSAAYQITGRYTGTALQPGQTICYIGAQTRISYCTPVADGDWEGLIEGIYLFNQFKHGGCTTSGDSGGPTYAGNTAYGLHIGYSGGSCNAIASYIRNVEDALGVRVRTT